MFANFVLLQLFILAIHGRNYEMLEMIQQDSGLEAYRQEQLQLHNYYRGLHGVSLMTMDETLNQHAQTFAEYLAQHDIGLKHCSEIPGCDNHREGENLARALGSITVQTNATEQWYSEVGCYDFCSTDSALQRPGHEGEPVGHFTQVVWAASTLLGIGRARTSDKTKVYVVARYKPAGNVYYTDQYKDNVLFPDYLSSVYQQNCDGVNGGYADLSEPGECTLPCDGGVIFLTKACINPKPSFNGADCSGASKLLASKEWCNPQMCVGSDMSHLDKQCQKRGKPADGSLLFVKSCTLYCNVNGYTASGTADDGTRCQFTESSDGACVDGLCLEMSRYTIPSGQTVTGSWTKVPHDNLWSNKFLEVPNGATGLTIINHDKESATIYICYVQGWSMGCSWVNTPGSTYNGVAYTYAQNTITIAGPVQMTSPDMVLAFSARKGDGGAAHITWTYTT